MLKWRIHTFIKLIFIFSFLIFQSCLKNKIKVVTKPASIAVSSVSISSNQLVINGLNLQGAKTIKLTGSSFDEDFTIESISSTTIIANGTRAITIAAGQIFDLIISNATGSATYSVDFAPANHSIALSKLDITSASSGQILKFNGTDWAPGNLSSSQTYQGTWNASTNNPVLADGGGSSGDYYIVSTIGTQDLGSGSVTYAVGDWVISGGLSATWDKVTGSLSGSGTANYIPYYSSSSTLAKSSMYLSAGKIGIKNTAPGALLDIGLAGTTLGTLRLEGDTSGYVQLQSSAAAGSWNMTLPTSAGTSGYVLQTNGSGVTSWVAQSGGGVSSVSSANTDIGVATGTTTPVLTLNTGTGIGQILKFGVSAQLPALDGSLLTLLNPAQLSSELLVGKGGTGATTLTAKGVLYGNGTSAIAATTAATLPSVLMSNIVTNLPEWVSSTTGNVLQGLTGNGAVFAPLTNISPGATNFTMTQNSVSAITSVSAGAVVDTLYLTAGQVGIGNAAPTVGTKLDVSGTIKSTDLIITGAAINDGDACTTTGAISRDTSSGDLFVCK